MRVSSNSAFRMMMKSGITISTTGNMRSTSKNSSTPWRPWKRSRDTA